MSNNTQFLVIADTLIHQDADGRYCLNDFHKAAGGEEKHKLSNFLRLEQTKALIEEINQGSDLSLDRCSEMSIAIEVIKGGNNQGTYGVKELVYAYAMWISPKFHLAVIRAYDALVTGTLIQKDSHIDELLATQRLLIESQQDQIAFIRETIDKQISKGLAEMAAKLEETEKTAKEQVTTAQRNEWLAKRELSSVQDKLDEQVKEFDLLMQSTRPIEADEARTILEWLYVRKMSTREVANFFYRSTGQICKVRKERYSRWSQVMDSSWEYGHAH